MSDLPPEIVEGMRLEAIFMPEARRHRDKAFAGSHLPRFAHYTSAENAINIIKSKRVWMRSTVCMSDFSEVQHGYDMLLHWFKNEDNQKMFISSFDAIFPGVANEAINAFDSHWNSGLRYKAFVASISEHDDIEDLNGRLSMWRAFGGNSTRVAIVLKPPAFSGAIQLTGAFFSPVAYLSDAGLDRVLREVSDNATREADFLRTLGKEAIARWIFQTLVIAVVSLKHEAFKEEREWRLISIPYMFGAALLTLEPEVIAGVPQRVAKFPLDQKLDERLSELDLTAILDRIIVGPTSFPLPVSEALGDILEAAGVANAREKVICSRIPIRG